MFAFCTIMGLAPAALGLNYAFRDKDLQYGPTYRINPREQNLNNTEGPDWPVTPSL